MLHLESNCNLFVFKNLQKPGHIENSFQFVIMLSDSVLMLRVSFQTFIRNRHKTSVMLREHKGIR